MAIENITQFDSTTATPTIKSTGDTITADTFRQMLDVLDTLANHNHTFYDDYNTVCECQCQCACNRGSI